MTNGDEKHSELVHGDGEGDEPVLFESEAGSRRWSTYVLAAFWWLLFLGPLAVNPMLVLFLPYSVPIGGLALWQTYGIATNRTQRLRVFRDRIAWRLTSSGRAPRVLLMRDVLRLTVEQREDDPTQSCVTVYLKDGTEELLPSNLIRLDEREALVRAIQQAAPGAFVRYRS